MNQQATTTLQNHERVRCEIWTRVMGYHRPVSSWNLGKQSEHQERQFFHPQDAAAGGC
ncbi:anaerobic ribonucleoside-triphosphate reductase [Halopseudomonas sp. SMJS2]|uniref:anaerobic ribonucleoside-triphosphate reductase n=1 Tax=Halopseudomonas sp. SMJS2 TaxID=3041098 RepID=UPI00245340A1|nr:anaerobic ribonucleoside-triphosphate reductase [Halopseudomonas sp. SMJS2]WGK62299.1 anaerobic ribonucleoside-triphosphate reductase [Halopseudomonas sp. SMJS2]